MIAPAARSTDPPSPACGPWPHRLAVLLVCAAFPLVFVGGLVTTYDAGMAVPDWPTTYGYNMFLYPWRTWIAGPWDLFIEHGHRLLGAAVGLLTLLVAVSVWACDRRERVRLLALGIVAAVILQGVLGGARVVLDERLLAQIHGTCGPAFFALAVALAVVTSRTWHLPAEAAERFDLGTLPRWTVATALLAFVEIAIGARMRHMPVGGEPGEFQVAVAFHLLVAALIAGHVPLLAVRVARATAARGSRRSTDQAARGLRRPAWALVLLVLAQIALGVFTWVANYGWPAWLGDYAWAGGHVIRARSLGQSLVTTAHVATGSLILAFAVTLALRTLRLARVVAGIGTRSRSMSEGSIGTTSRSVSEGSRVLAEALR